MENRRNVMIIPLILAGFFVLFAQKAGAYSSDTHAYLTQKAIETFNKSHPESQIPQESLSYIIDGTRREDDPPRWMNHFYDPVYNRGLSRDTKIDPLYSLGTWQKSKDWAQDGDNQSGLAYSPVIATVLSSIQAGKIQEFFPTSDFTWNEALGYWIRGDKEMALFTLGHILHLLEDASVPDHTRNDPHPGDSPYETYTEKFTTETPDYVNEKRNSSISPKALPDLNSYFVELAAYSNNNFYSKDTIGIQSGYSKPQPDYIQKEGDFSYGYLDKPEKHRILVTKSGQYDYITSKNNVSLTEENGKLKVLDDYWTLLSQKSIEYSAGTIDLFFKEAEKNKDNPAFQKSTSWFAQVLEFASSTADFLTKQLASLFGGSDEVIISIPIPSATPSGIMNSPQNPLHSPVQLANVVKTPSPVPSVKQTPHPSIKPSPSPNPTPKASPKPSPSPKISPSPTPIQNNCAVPKTNPYPIYNPLIINEVAWMGTTGGATNEWIELKNISPVPVQLSGWGLKNADSSLTVLFPNKTVQPGGYVLLERTDDSTVPGIKADIIYKGSLSNSGEQIYLFDPHCALIDAITGTKWPAGNASERRTMERNGSTKEWHTSSVINGTPKRDNSTPVSNENKKSPGTSHTPADPSPSPSVTPSVSPSPKPSPVPVDIRINEIFYNPEGNDEGQEWVEIKNEDDGIISITDDWRFSERENKHFIIPSQETLSIEPGGYAVIANSTSSFLEAYPDFTGTLFKSSFSLNNSSATLALYNGDLELDAVSYASSSGGYENGKSLQKIGGEWLEGIPTPGADNYAASSSEEAPGDPGEKPHPVQNVSRRYEFDHNRTYFSWNDSLNENVTYLLYDITDPEDPVLIDQTADKETSVQLKEVGKKYTMKVVAQNIEGKTSDPVLLSFETEPFVQSADFFFDAGSGAYTIAFSFPRYPIVPEIGAPGVGGATFDKKALVVFLNKEAPTPIYIGDSPLDTRNQVWTPEEQEGILRLKYRYCQSGTMGIRDMLTLPDYDYMVKGMEACGPVFTYQDIDFENGTITVGVDMPEGFVPDEHTYLTLGYYDMQFVTVYTLYELVAADRTKYYFDISSIPPETPDPSPSPDLSPSPSPEPSPLESPGSQESTTTPE